jgi:hypothetical protein
MKKISKTTKPPTADQLADMAERGESLKRFFPGKGRMIRPVQRVNVDFSQKMLQELDREASELNISRQAVIKTLVRQALDQHYVAVAGKARVA